MLGLLQFAPHALAFVLASPKSQWHITIPAFHWRQNLLNLICVSIGRQNLLNPTCRVLISQMSGLLSTGTCPSLWKVSCTALTYGCASCSSAHTRVVLRIARQYDFEFSWPGLQMSAPLFAACFRLTDLSCRWPRLLPGKWAGRARRGKVALPTVLLRPRPQQPCVRYRQGRQGKGPEGARHPRGGQRCEEGARYSMCVRFKAP